MKTLSRKHLLVIVALTVVVIAAAGAALFLMRSDDARYTRDMPRPGTMAPDFYLRAIPSPADSLLALADTLHAADDGPTAADSLRLSDLRGRYVVIDFWASWCHDCRDSAPEVSALARRFMARGVQFVGYSFDVNPRRMAAAAAHFHLDYPHVSELKLIKDSPVGQAYGVRATPTFVVVDPEGRVVLCTTELSRLEQQLLEIAPAAK